MTTEKKPPRRKKTKKEYIQMLLRTLAKWQREGATPEEALERLTVRQYDMLLDADVNLDNLIFTEAELKAIQEIKRAPRPNFPDGYSKRYPETKQALYSSLVEHLKSQGAVIQEREKQNFRDLDFSIGDTVYKIVLSNPRTPKA